MEYLVMNLQNIKENIEAIINCNTSYRYTAISSLIEILKNLDKYKDIEDFHIAYDLGDFYYKIKENNVQDFEKIVAETNIYQKLSDFIDSMLPRLYLNLYVNYESYKAKILMWYDNENMDNIIAFVAGSFYTDQEFRTFMSNFQKGLYNIKYKLPYKMNFEYYPSLKSLKNKYISHVKKNNDLNTQDGYHAEIHLDTDRFFLLMDDDSPVDAVYDWIVRNTQAAVLDDWKTYLYNKLVEGGYIKECKSVNLTNINIRGIVLSEEVNTDLIRQIRYEGLSTNEISIPREPVDLDESMSFIEVMNKFIIPEIKQKETRCKVGEPFSPYIESPIIAKHNGKIKKYYLYNKQKVIAQGILNAVKAGKHSIILNGGMGIGKTYISIKATYAILKEHFKTNNGRIAVYCQGHLIPKWERQFKEALPNVKLKFIKINNYKDVFSLENKKPDGIEVYLLPKDKVKRKYLVTFAARDKFNLTTDIDKLLEGLKFDVKGINLINGNNIKISEFKVIARKIEKCEKVCICLYKEVIDAEGKVLGYKVVTTSNVLKEKFGKSYRAYDFIIDDLSKLQIYKNLVQKEYENKIYVYKTIQNGLVCPDCGSFIYNKESERFSEEDYIFNVIVPPDNKKLTNKQCNGYIKVDGTPLMEFERMGIIKNKIAHFIAIDNEKYPYYDENNNPITDQETIMKIKSGYYDKPYSIALKKCNTPHWTVDDRKGYRTVNSIDMIKRRFGNFFLCSISDECHLYSAESSQGNTFGILCQISKINLALTGTLTGGKASHLFYMLYRMIPEKMSKFYKYNEISKFIDHYGRKKKVIKEYHNDEYNKSGSGKITSSGWNEIPGISPMLYSHFLSDIMISRKIEDMNFDMPELKFYKHEVQLTDELREGYEKLKQDLVNFMTKYKEINLGGTYLNALLSYPDLPFNEPLKYENLLISNPIPIDIEDKLLPKEEKLIETIKKELMQNRRVVVFITYTGLKAIDNRVEKVLKDAGFKVAVLKSSVNTEKREKWIDDAYKKGVEVIITNPKLVQTGLDILNYPTIYFYEVDYDVRVTRQAESRAWRPNQEKTCKVYYSYYADTLQFDALKLIGSKKKASLALEGVFAEDILSDMGDIGDSGAAQLYKALLGKVKLKEDDLDFFSEEEEIEIIDEVEYEVEDRNTIFIPETDDELGTQLSLFTLKDSDIKAKPRKERRKLVSGQLSLFDF